MSNHHGAKRVFWKNGLFWVGLIIAIYLVGIQIEEIAYHKFINREWSAHVLEYTNENSPLLGDYMKSLLTDNEGQIWIATDQAINKVSSDDAWTIYTGTTEGSWTITTNDHEGVPIRSLATDKAGRIWVGTFDGLYVLNRDGQWSTYDEKSKIVYESYTSNAIVVDRFDRIWVANDEGLRMFLPDGTKTFFTKENSGLPDDYITALAEDPQGHIWIGTYRQGVVVFDTNGQWKTYQVDGSPTGAFDKWVTALFIDAQDRVWVGMKSGKFSTLTADGNWTTYDVYPYGIQSDPAYDDKDINVFAMDEQGRLWIGTADALFALDQDGTWTAYTQVNSGLSPDHISALAIDGNGRLWITTFQETIVFDLNNQLPKPIPNKWILVRTKLLAPIAIVTEVADVLFAPSMIFAYTSSYLCSFVYMALWLLITLATVGMIRGARQGNPKFLSISRRIFIFSAIGILILYCLAILAAAIPT